MKVNHTSGTGQHCFTCGHEFLWLWEDREEKNGETETKYGKGPICSSCQNEKGKPTNLTEVENILKERQMFEDNKRIRKRLTKTALNEIIRWSNSRYETFKKFEVVNEIYQGLKDGKRISNDGKEILREKWYSGAYCQGSNMNRKGEYFVDYKEGILADCDFEGANDEIKKVNAVYVFPKKEAKKYVSEEEFLGNFDDDASIQYQSKAKN
jgi:hypothetical protein